MIEIKKTEPTPAPETAAQPAQPAAPAAPKKTFTAPSYAPPGGGAKPAAAEKSQAPEEEMAPPKPTIGQRMKNLTALLKEKAAKNPKAAIIAIAVIVSIPVGTGIYYSLQARMVLNSAQEAMESGDYAQSARLFEKYLTNRPDDFATVQQMAKARALSGEDAEVDRALKFYEKYKREKEADNNPNFWYGYGVASLHKQAATTPEHFERALEDDPFHVPSMFALGLHALLFKSDFSTARSYFQKAQKAQAQGGSDELTPQAATREIAYLRAHFFRTNNLSYGANRPLPFNELRVQPPFADDLEFDLSTEVFGNYYYIPFRSKEIAREEISPEATFPLFLALVEAQLNNSERALKHADEAHNIESTVLGGFILGYLHSGEGDFEGAAARYEEIIDNQNDAGGDAKVMRANAKWSLSGGSRPSADIIALYRQVLEVNENNLLAINNLGFGLMYESSPDEAYTLFKRGFSLSSSDVRLALNTAILDLVYDNHADSRLKLYSIRKKLPKSKLLLNAIVKMELGTPNIKNAIAAIRRLQETDTVADASTSLLIANLFNRRAQPLLAIAELKKAQKQFPDSTSVIAALALNYILLDERKRAKKLLNDNADVVNNSHYKILEARAALLAERDAIASHRLLLSALKKAPNKHAKESIILDIGRLLLASNKMEEAQETITEAVKENPSLALRALELRAKSAADKTQVAAEAIDALLQESIDDNNTVAQVDLCWAYINIEKYAPPIAHLNSVLKSGIETVEILAPLKVAYEKNFDREEELETGKRIQVVKRIVKAAAAKEETEAKKKEDAQSRTVISGVDTSEEGLLGKINDAVRRQSFKEAIRWYTELIQTGSVETANPALDYQNRGALYLAIKDFDQAAADFGKALSIGGLDPSQEVAVLFNQGQALFRAGKFSQAVSALGKAIKIEVPQGEKIKHYALLGGAYRRLKDYNNAELSYKSAIDIAPQQVSLYLSLAKVYNITRNFPESLRTLNTALKLNSRNIGTHLLLAETYTLQGDTGKANEHRNIVEELRGI